MSNVQEVLFLGLPGPYHSYSGLAPGNLASEKNQGDVANPRLAARQTLELARTLLDAGVKVAIIPPQMRPEHHLLYRFMKHRAADRNDDEALRALASISAADKADIVRYAAQYAPRLLKQTCSSASMWTANAGTVTPAVDCTDAMTHITPANLITNTHRAIEAAQTTLVLKDIFKEIAGITVHEPLSADRALADEGAANHIRLAPSHGERGLHVFVYGRDDGDPSKPVPRKNPARQSRAASEAIARRHGVRASQALFIQQDPDAIDQGVFHNDVISVGNGDVLLYHEKSFVNGDRDIEAIRDAYQHLHPGEELTLVPVSEAELTVKEAADTYFFNSQLVTLPDGRMTLVSPKESEDNPRARDRIQAIINDPANPIGEVKYKDLKQSMKNGGGPACLRLRVLMTDDEIRALEAQDTVLLDDQKIETLDEFAGERYRDTLEPRDLADPALHAENEQTIVALYRSLNLVPHASPDPGPYVLAKSLEE